MKCKYCGEQFVQNKYGVKKEYCNKPECIRKARNESQRKWYAKKMEALKGSKIKVIENKTINNEKEEKKIVYSSTDKENTKLEMQDFGNILKLARDLGTVRFQLIQLAQKESLKMSDYDKQDQDFLHNLEFLDELTEEEAIKMVLEEKKSREKRRNVKNRHFLISALLDGILIKNPNQYVIQIIQKSKSLKYAPRVIKELQKDENLYVIKKEGIKEEGGSKIGQ